MSNVTSPITGRATFLGRIDWSGAEVNAQTLRLPFAERPSGVWIQRLNAVLMALESDDDPWIAIRAERHSIVVEGVRRGLAPDLHRRLEDAVARTNAIVADEDQPATRGQPRNLAASALSSLALIALAAAAVAVQRLGWAAPVRPAIAVAFVTIGPGWALLKPWRLSGGWIGAGLIIAVSLSLAMVVSGAMVYAGMWSPYAALLILAGFTVLGCLVSLLRDSAERSSRRSAVGQELAPRELAATRLPASPQR